MISSAHHLFAALAAAAISAACGRTETFEDAPLRSAIVNPSCDMRLVEGLDSPHALQFSHGKLFWHEVPDDFRDLEVWSFEPCVEGATPERIATEACCLGKFEDEDTIYWMQGDVVHIVGPRSEDIRISSHSRSVAVDGESVYWQDFQDSRLFAMTRRGRNTRVLGSFRTGQLIGVRGEFVFDVAIDDAGARWLRRLRKNGNEETLLRRTGIFMNWIVGPDALYGYGFECVVPEQECFSGPIIDPKNVRSIILRVDTVTGEQTALVAVESDFINDLVITRNALYWAQPTSIWRAELDGSRRRRLSEADPMPSLAANQDVLFWASLGWGGDVARQGVGSISRLGLP